MPHVYLRAMEPPIEMVLDTAMRWRDPFCPLKLAIAALIGRFLPGLGPLVPPQAALVLWVPSRPCRAGRMAIALTLRAAIVLIPERYGDK